MSASRPTVRGTPTVALVAQLCAALDAAGVRYCHFKSNAALDRSRAGINDLDLLVHRADGGAFAGVLHGLGFKAAMVHRTKALPGVQDFYGHEPSLARPIHVHAHFQLVVGDDLTKNYRVPLEQAYLDGSVRDGEFPVPPPELELILLVIRLVLKHFSWDAFALRLASMPASARAELEYLEARVDEARLRDELARWLPRLSPDTFGACRRALRPDAGALERMAAGRRLLAALEPYARRPRREDVALKLWRRVAGVARRAVARPVPRRRLAAGGAVIALVGADGAGKSTALDAVEDWLRRDLDLTRIHLGRPPKSIGTRVLKALVMGPSAPAALLRRHTALLGGSKPSRVRQRAVLAVALARDRHRLSRRARRAATNGGLVLSDRFPVPQLTLMDAPRVQRLLGTSKGPLAGRLCALEQRFYGSIVPPDVLIVLLVDPEVAVARKPDEPAAFVRERWAAMWEVDWRAITPHVIDAGRPAAEVLADVKSVIWSEM